MYCEAISTIKDQVLFSYRLNKLTKRAKGVRVILPGIEDRIGTVQSYRRVLNAMLTALAAEVKRDIIPRYAMELNQKRALKRLSRDAVGRDWFSRLRAVSVALARTSDDAVERILILEAHRHSNEFIDVAKRALGVDVSMMVRNEDLGEYLEMMAARNASLITSLSEDIVKQVEQAVLQNVVAGNSVKTLRKTLTDRFGMAQARADLIATDQTAKLVSDLNRIRHEQAGVTSYVWTTSHDERVRTRHRQLDGRTYKYGEQTGAENGLPPGQPIRCRCVARGVVEF